MVVAYQPHVRAQDETVADSVTVHGTRSVPAAFCDDAPTIDGVLDEECWARASSRSRFVQRFPEPGEAAQSPTTLRVLYDHGHIYVGLQMKDRKPEEIRRVLGRRDSSFQADRVTLHIDPLQTGQRAFFFAVNAAGILTDGVIYNQTQRDRSWDTVWKAATTVHDDGWTAEFRIPLATIPFQDAEVQEWGFYVERFVNRTQEVAGWPAVPPSGNSFISDFGTLAELEGMRRPSKLRIQPYAAAAIQLGQPAGAAPVDGFAPNAGVDLQYSPTPKLRLVFALNPDFGEVDQDPEVVNLSPQEVFLTERRPFFAAGLDLFRTPTPPSKGGRFVFLNTRRIGGQAPSVENVGGGVVIEADTQRRILGALTALGEADRNTSYGVMSVLEEPSRAVVSTVSPVRGTVQVQERETAPFTHYGVLRGRRRLGGRSYVGAMGTTVNRIGETSTAVRPSGELTADTDAYVGLVDWELRNKSGGQFVGFLSAAHSSAGTGAAGFFQLGQLGFHEWIYKAELEFYSGGYDINDLGFLPRTDHYQFVFRVDRQLLKPWGVLRSGGVALTTLQAVRFADLSETLQRRFRFNAYGTFQNNWRISTAIGYNAPVVDELETRGGPLFPRPYQVRWDTLIATDNSQAVSTELRARVEREGDGWRIGPRLTTSALLANRLTLTLLLSWRSNRQVPRYVETIRDRGLPQYMIGDLDFEEFEARLTGSLGITRTLTLQTFVQVLWAKGHYQRFYELVQSSGANPSFVETDYLLGEERDFVRASLSSNTVLRWDLGAGTAALLAYRLEGALSRAGSSAPFSFRESFNGLLGRGFSQRLLLKVSYAWSTL